MAIEESLEGHTVVGPSNEIKVEGKDGRKTDLSK